MTVFSVYTSDMRYSATAQVVDMKKVSCDL
jgi:hypothetical protein